jgi:hypothetical protein
MSGAQDIGLSCCQAKSSEINFRHRLATFTLRGLLALPKQMKAWDIVDELGYGQFISGQSLSVRTKQRTGSSVKYK